MNKYQRKKQRKEKIQWASKYMKRCLTSGRIQVMQIKARSFFLIYQMDKDFFKRSAKPNIDTVGEHTPSQTGDDVNCQAVYQSAF